MKEINIFKYDYLNKTNDELFSDSLLKQVMNIQKKSFNSDIYFIINFFEELSINDSLELYLATTNNGKKVVSYALVETTPKESDSPSHDKYLRSVEFYKLNKFDYAFPYISSFAVAKGYRGKGIGKQVFKYVLDNIDHKSKNSCLLAVASNIPAVKLYQSEGFLISQLTKFYGDVDGYFMVNFKDDQTKTLSDFYYELLKKAVNKENGEKFVEDFKNYVKSSKNNTTKELAKLIDASVKEFSKIKQNKSNEEYSISDYLEFLKSQKGYSLPTTIKPMLKTTKVYKKANKETLKKFENIRLRTQALANNDYILKNNKNVSNILTKYDKYKIVKGKVEISDFFTKTR